MSEQPPIIPQGNAPENAGVAFLSRHRFIVLLVAAILISLVLTAVSLAIYNSSGAAQLDLSRPGYRSVSDQFEQASTVYWLPTYETRENPEYATLPPEVLTENVTNKHALIYAQLDQSLWDEIQKARQQGKLVLTMGAGTIDGWVRRQLAQS